MEAKKKTTIGRKTIKVIILFALIIIIAISAAVCYGVLVMKMRDFSEETFDYAQLAAKLIDGDKVAEYADTGKKDQYYEDIERDLESFKEEFDLNKCYIAVPDGDELISIWCISNDENDLQFGEREDLGALHEFYYNVFTKNPPETPIRVKGTEGVNIIALSPIFNRAGEPVAVVSIDRTDPTMASVLAQFFFLILIISSIIAVIMMLIAYLIMKRNIITPIGVLTKSVGEMVGNVERDEDVKIDVHTNDELETLADTFTKMDIDMRQYIKELSEITSEKEKILAELDLAARIQIGMLPKLEPPFADNDRFDLYASMHAAKEVGGDFYDFFMVDDKYIALLIADVSGKGIPAALFTVVTKALIKNEIKRGKGPAEALSSVNETLMESNSTGSFVTVWLAIIDLETGKGIAVNAGHEHPILRKAGGDFEQVKYKHMLPVATMGGIRFEEHEFAIEPGDTIFVNTDGVTEAINERDEAFGDERLIAALNDNKEASLEDLLGAVTESINDFAGDTPQFDDETMLAFRYKG